ncbi:hypothetical protein [Lacibacter sediminis]|uniref:Uncharacterized protein n=1 Tax=Lacibacter sediminis TaxID=2760713 RepID=A0A7G5XCE1_9BACT|nr:hypothetical protein [Lacibacter sediminis]QNA43144.1 hypothetical protein H4075_13750 [Lacibacter sediminis]
MKEGKIYRHIDFIYQGSFRACSNKDGEDITTGFYLEGICLSNIKASAERSVHTAYLYTSGTAVMETASFLQIEMNAIELKVSTLNHCESCMKGHCYLLKKAGGLISKRTSTRTCL